MKKKLTNKDNGAVLIVDDTQIAIYGGNCVLLDTSYRFSLLEWELSDYEEKPPLYYIRGNKKRGDEVIKMLEEKGGENEHWLKGTDKDWFYYIGNSLQINYCYEHSDYGALLQQFGTELHLPEKVEKEEDGHLLSQDDLDRLANDICNDIKKSIDNAFKKLHFRLKEE